MNDATVLPVLLSGGAGTRLWPESRQAYPKQFLPLAGEKTLLQQTWTRVDGLAGCASPMVICNEEHRFLVGEQLATLGAINPRIVLEPCGRNTAPAAAVAAFLAMADGDDPLLLLLPADHAIADASSLHTAIRSAAAYASTGQIMTFGVVPTTAHTGYGYIRAGGALAGVPRSVSAHEGVVDAYEVMAFVEKPDESTAQKYFRSGDYFWNSGMFLLRASILLEELEANAPEIYGAAKRAHHNVMHSHDFVRLDEQAYSESPSNSIDYAVMEHTNRAGMVPLDVGWSDVGSWSSLWEIGQQDKKGNVTRGDVFLTECHDNYVRSSGRLVAMVGMNDSVVIETADAVFVAPKERAQDVKLVVDHLKGIGRTEVTNHRRVARPWGAYDSIGTGSRFQVKRITVNPGASLSLQMHHHRAEHWVVVKGTARVTCGDDTFLLSENESTFISIGQKHRMENPGSIPLEIIEVQSGSYLGEDDIVRFDDNYGRC